MIANRRSLVKRKKSSELEKAFSEALGEPVRVRVVGDRVSAVVSSHPHAQDEVIELGKEAGLIYYDRATYGNEYWAYFYLPIG